MLNQADLKNLHILLVGGRPASVQVMRTAFGMLGVSQIMFVAEAARAIDTLRAQTFDAIFCDAGLETFKTMIFPVAARRAHGVLNPMTPVFIVYQTARQRQVEQARDGGVTDVLTHPVSAATIARKLEAALERPRSFIAAPNFVGPDRRAARSDLWSGEERRKRTARRAKVAFPEAPSSGDIVLV